MSVYEGNTEITCPCEEYISGEIEGCHECPYVEVGE